MEKLVTITYLEMTDRAGLRRARDPEVPFLVTRAEIPSPEMNRFFYKEVGGQWLWYERLVWDDARWLQYLERPEVETWVGYLRGTLAGYFELEREEGDVQIAYFGLLPRFIGKGLGGPLLTKAIERAWEMGAKRVWVHTCDLDHPQALANYVARGMKPYHTEKKFENIPYVPTA
jgi:GNAT superfamily N-acetyltransferase